MLALVPVASPLCFGCIVCICSVFTGTTTGTSRRLFYVAILGLTAEDRSRPEIDDKIEIAEAFTSKLFGHHHSAIKAEALRYGIKQHIVPRSIIDANAETKPWIIFAHDRVCFQYSTDTGTIDKQLYHMVKKDLHNMQNIS